MIALQGKTVVVTGASGGIGSALCTALADAGAHVIAVARRAAPLRVLAGRLGDRVTPLAADLSTVEGRAALVDLAAHRPEASILVIAHARGHFGLFDEQSASAVAAVLHDNLVAPCLLVNEMLPVLRRRGAASVVAVGSTFASIGFPGFAAYSAAKFGLRGLFEALAREHADDDLHFQFISPRATRTPFNTPAVDALNRTLGVRTDSPEAVAKVLLAAIRRGDVRRQLGWPEKLFARLNGLVPELVDRSLRRQLPVIRRHASQGGDLSKESYAHET